MITKKEKQHYLMPEKRDFKILTLIHELEETDLSDQEEFLISWTRTQLEKDWRDPLLNILKLLKENTNKTEKERLIIIQEFAKENFWRP